MCVCVHKSLHECNWCMIELSYKWKVHRFFSTFSPLSTISNGMAGNGQMQLHINCAMTRCSDFSLKHLDANPSCCEVWLNQGASPLMRPYGGLIISQYCPPVATVTLSINQPSLTWVPLVDGCCHLTRLHVPSHCHLSPGGTDRSATLSILQLFPFCYFQISSERGSHKVIWGALAVICRRLSESADRSVHILDFCGKWTII